MSREPQRTILHLDLDAFFCCVEEQRDPGLVGIAFAVGGQPGQRGVVATCSYAARRFGVRSAMPMATALRLCPHLVIVPSRHGEYRAASTQVMQRLRALTPLVEQLSIDEAFLDVTALSEPGEVLARRLQAQIRSELGLACSLGVAANKLVAKIATDVGKAEAAAASARADGEDRPPNAVKAVPEGTESQFLAPLPVSALWGVGPKTEARLQELGLRRIGDIARWPQTDLVRRLGRMGYDLSLRALGIDERPVVPERDAKSVSSENTFARDISEPTVLVRELHALVTDVAETLRRKGYRGNVIKVKLRWSDFTTVTRQTSLPHPTDTADVLWPAARQLLKAIWQSGRGVRAVRLLGFGVSGLCYSTARVRGNSSSVQPSLFDLETLPPGPIVP